MKSRRGSRATRRHCNRADVSPVPCYRNSVALCVPEKEHHAFRNREAVQFGPRKLTSLARAILGRTCSLQRCTTAPMVAQRPAAGSPARPFLPFRTPSCSMAQETSCGIPSLSFLSEWRCNQCKIFMELMVSQRVDRLSQSGWNSIKMHASVYHAIGVSNNGRNIYTKDLITDYGPKPSTTAIGQPGTVETLLQSKISQTL